MSMVLAITYRGSFKISAPFNPDEIKIHHSEWLICEATEA